MDTKKFLTTNVLLLEISDHLPVTCSINLKPDQVNINKLTRNMKNFDKEKFLNEVNNLIIRLSNDLYSASSTNSVDHIDKSCNNFVDSFKNIVNAHAPKRPMSKRKSKQTKTLDD